MRRQRRPRSRRCTSITGRITSRPTRSPNFTKETGIAVTYDVYDSNEVLEAKLLAGHSGYDIVVPSASPYHGAADRGRRVPRARQGETAEPEEPRSARCWRSPPPPIPATATACRICGASPASATTSAHGRAGARATAAPLDSLALMFDPAIAEKLAGCGISLLDTPQEVFPAALAYLGLDPKSRDPGRSRQGRRAARDDPPLRPASSTPRNTSTTSPTAICASRSAIRAT